MAEPLLATSESMSSMTELRSRAASVLSPAEPVLWMVDSLRSMVALLPSVAESPRSTAELVPSMTGPVSSMVEFVAWATQSPDFLKDCPNYG